MSNPKIEISENQRQALKKVMAKHGLNILSWTTKAGISEGTLRGFLKGVSNSMGSDNLELLADAAGITIGEMLGENERPQTPVVGYAGAGIVYAFDDHLQGAGLEYVDTPQGINNKNLVAVRVKGDSMRPMMLDGWLVFYGRDSDGVPPDCVGRVCIVKLVDDGVAVREVKQGSKPNHYHLVAYNGETTFDAQLTWASRVLNIRPS
jgi:hypothetical protein